MKKLIDNLAVVMVMILFGVVIALVVRYNMIDEQSIDVLVILPDEQPAKKKEDPEAYLQSLESYGEDVDVAVDPTKEIEKNRVKVESELVKDDLEDVLQTDEKKDYLKSLEYYSQKKQPTVKTERLEDVKPEQEQNNDTIGDELDSIIGE